MYCADGCEPMVVRSDDRAQVCALDRGKNLVRTFRLLVARHELAIVQLRFAVMQAMVIAVDSKHAVAFSRVAPEGDS